MFHTFQDRRRQMGLLTAPRHVIHNKDKYSISNKKYHIPIKLLELSLTDAFRFVNFFSLGPI